MQRFRTYLFSLIGWSLTENGNDYHAITARADLIGSAVYGVGLRPLACWDCGFESRLWHGWMLLWALYVVR